MNNTYSVLDMLAILLKQGYPLSQIISLSKTINNHPLISVIEVGLAEGKDLRASILDGKLPKRFREFFYFFSMQKEVSQAIIDSLEICQQRSATIKRFKKQLYYPAFLLIFIFFFSIFVSSFLMPEVQLLFKEFTIKPNVLFTVTMLSLRWIPIVFIVLISISVIVLGICLYAIKKQRHAYIDWFILRIPMIGKYIKKYYSITFAIYYNELLQANYDTTKIITILTNQMMDTDIKMIVCSLQRDIEQGKDLWQSLKDFGYFEEMLVAYFLLLLKNHKHKNALLNYLDVSEKILQSRIDTMIRVLLPSIYGFVMVFVLVVYLSIILPMMQIIDYM